MYQKILNYFKEKPILYAPSTAPFWDDEHISKGMLEAHLAVEVEAASRKYSFIEKSAEWISKKYIANMGASLLDLGCGPGIYAELFSKAGFSVTGIDFSKRSIQYAAQKAEISKLPIRYFYKNYLDIDYQNAFDVITIIYCDFGVLPVEDRKVLLTKIKKALKSGGSLILDGWTQGYMEQFAEGSTVEYCSQGFWSAEPYMCIQNNYNYPDSSNYLEQYIVVTKDNCQCYNNWNQIYTEKSLEKELRDAGFSDIAFYDDVAGKTFTGSSNTICAAAK